MFTVIGIELGRKFSRVGVFRNNTFEIIFDEKNRSVVPSYVAFTGDGPPLVGYPALDQVAENPANTIYDVRSVHDSETTIQVPDADLLPSLLIGRKFMNPEVLAAIKTFPFKVAQRDDEPEIIIPGEKLDQGFTPSEISAMVLAKLKTMAEAHLNETLASAIITVPDDFDEDQREATRNAAKMAGLDALRIVSESTAAGIGYGFDIPNDPYGSKTDLEHFIVYHLDAKESKLALLSADHGVFEHLAVVKNEGLSGEVFENDFIEDMQLKEDAVDLVKKILQKGELDKSKLDGLVFTGDPSHVASIQSAIERYLSMKARSFQYPSKVPVSTNDAIVRGAALQAFHMEPWRGCVLTMEVTPLDYGIEISQGIFARVLKRNFVIPTRRMRTFVTTLNDQEKVVIPVFEGFRHVASKNRLLGTLELVNLPHRSRGEVEIELSFEMDAYYVLTVVAKVKGSGLEAKLRVPPDFAEYYGDDGIERLMEEAKEYHEEELVYLKGFSHDSVDEKGDDGFQVMLRGGNMDLDLAFGL